MKKDTKPAKENPAKNSYTVTEVGTLLESMDKKIDLIAEGHAGTNERLEKVETSVLKLEATNDRLEVAVHGNSRRLDMVEFRLDGIEGDVSRMKDGMMKLTKDLKDTREILEKKIDGVENKLDEAKLELKGDIQKLGDRLSTVETHS